MKYILSVLFLVGCSGTPSYLTHTVRLEVEKTTNRYQLFNGIDGVIYRIDTINGDVQYYSVKDKRWWSK